MVPHTRQGFKHYNTTEAASDNVTRVVHLTVLSWMWLQQIN